MLMYHRLGKPTGGDRSLWIGEETFVRQLGWLQDNGYKTLSIGDAVALVTSNRAPRNKVLITIDDAFAETLTIAARTLIDFDMRATTFVAAGLMGQEVELRSPTGEAFHRPVDARARFRGSRCPSRFGARAPARVARPATGPA